LNVSQLKRPHGKRTVITKDTGQKHLTFQRTDNILVMNQGTDEKSNFWVDIRACRESSSHYHWKTRLQY